MPYTYKSIFALKELLIVKHFIKIISMGSFPLASRSQSQRDCSLSAKSRTQLNFGRSEAEFVRSGLSSSLREANPS